MTIRGKSGPGLGKTALAALLVAASSVPAYAVEPALPPQAVVTNLDHSLLDVMQHAQKLGFKGRYAALEPVVRQVFDVPFMTRVAVGPGWAQLSETQQQQLSDAFGKFITATYARRFDGYSGETFVETGAHPSGSNMMVETKLVKSSGEPIALDYVTRQNDGRWQVVDVFLTGTISELATRRSEFSSVFARAGFDGLLQTLQQKTAQIATDSQLG
jgi:phospholipid transport system substrate-binding protein